MLWSDCQCRHSRYAADVRLQCSDTLATGQIQERQGSAPVLFIAPTMPLRSPAALMSWQISPQPCTTTSSPWCSPKGTSWIMTGTHMCCSDQHVIIIIMIKTFLSQEASGMCDASQLPPDQHVCHLELQPMPQSLPVLSATVHTFVEHTKGGRSAQKCCSTPTTIGATLPPSPPFPRASSRLMAQLPQA